MAFLSGEKSAVFLQNKNKSYMGSLNRLLVLFVELALHEFCLWLQPGDGHQVCYIFIQYLLHKINHFFSFVDTIFYISTCIIEFFIFKRFLKHFYDFFICRHTVRL